ncbi:MAG: glycosyltransferase family 2 protein [Sulfuricaulis sp.]
MTETPLVSIGMPVFNSEKTLAPAIRSILNQTYRDWELLIVDDGSTDRSLQIAQGFRDARIRVIAGGERRGIAVRLNQLVAAGRGKYFARMDGDDIAFPARIERQVSHLEAHPEIDLLGAAVIVFRNDGSLAGRMPVEQSHAAICARPCSGFYLPHPTWMGRRAWFARHGYDESASGAEDQHLLFRTYPTSRFACLSEILLGYREDRRSLKRMLARRHVFLRALLRHAMENRMYGIAARLLVTQVAKAGADVLNLVFGIRRMRNRLLEVDDATRETWADMWRMGEDTKAGSP